MSLSAHIGYAAHHEQLVIQKPNREMTRTRSDECSEIQKLMRNQVTDQLHLRCIKHEFGWGREVANIKQMGDVIRHS